MATGTRFLKSIRLGNADFLRLWAGQSVALVGSQVTVLALPLVAALTLGASASQVAILGAIRWLPFLALSLAAGVAVDRFPRRPILIAADLIRVVLLMSIPMAAALGVLTMVHLLVVSFLLGVCDMAFATAVQAFLPTLSARADFLEYNRRLSLSDSIARVGGPGLAGALVQAVTAPFALGASALSLGASALCIATIRKREAPPVPSERPAFLRGMVDGVRIVSSDPIRRALVLAGATANLFSASVFASGVFILYVTRDLRLEPGKLGVIFAGGGGGFVAGSLLASATTRRFGFGRSMIGLLALWGISCLLLSLAQSSAPGDLALLIAGYFSGAFAFSSYAVTSITVQQLITPSSFLGRVSGFNRTVTWGVLPLGSLLGGFLAEAIGLRAALVIGACGMALSSVWLLLSPLSTWRSAGADGSGGQ